MLRAVLFDVGGPLDTEVTHEARWDALIRSELDRAGVAVDDISYTAAARYAVEAFAPNAYQAIIWRLTNADASLAQRVYAAVVRAAARENTFELRAGMPELLHELHERGLLLGIVANQPSGIQAQLESAGVAQYFDFLGISETIGFRKPDSRLFLAACDALGVEPAECIMVGDRIDNDVVPARLLGMRTVLLRSGRHIAQQPRSWLEVPDFEVRDVDEMRAAILSS
ncbi:MAG TPA: HAD-IA family hydrolase [Chloroflexota bacterium]